MVPYPPTLQRHYTRSMYGQFSSTPRLFGTAHYATETLWIWIMERLQAAVARSLFRSERTSPKSELRSQLEWPALRWRREISGMTFFTTSCLNFLVYQHVFALLLTQEVLAPSANPINYSLTLKLSASLSHFSFTQQFCGIHLLTLYS